MLNIIVSYNCIQYQGKLMNQTWENGRKPSFAPDFGPNLVPIFFFFGFTSTRCYALLQAIIVWDWFWLLLPKFYLCYILGIIASYRCMQFQGKPMNQTWENGKKHSFGTDFGSFGPHFTSTTCSALLQAIVVCNFKEN